MHFSGLVSWIYADGAQLHDSSVGLRTTKGAAKFGTLAATALASIDSSFQFGSGSPCSLWVGARCRCVALVEKAVSQGEARLTGRVLRLTAAFRKRLTTDAVAACVNETLPAAAPSKAALLAALSASSLPAAGPATSVRARSPPRGFSRFE